VEFAHDNSSGDAVKIAHAADVAIVIVGNHPNLQRRLGKCPLPK